MAFEKSSQTYLNIDQSTFIAQRIIFKGESKLNYCLGSSGVQLFYIFKFMMIEIERFFFKYCFKFQHHSGTSSHVIKAHTRPEERR